MVRQDDYITTNEAGGHLGVTRQRVLQLIQDGRLKAEKFGNVYMIRRPDLSNIESKPMGRPPKAKVEATNGQATTPTAATKKGAEERRRRNKVVDGLLSDRKAAQDSEKAAKKGGKK